MKLRDKEGYEKVKSGELDPYVQAIFKVAEKTMDLLDNVEVIDANDLILQADKELNEDITGNMAGMIAMLVSKYHERGDEFKKSWNSHYGRPEAKGVINPAILVSK